MNWVQNNRGGCIFFFLCSCVSLCGSMFCLSEGHTEAKVIHGAEEKSGLSKAASSTNFDKLCFQSEGYFAEEIVLISI